MDLRHTISEEVEPGVWLEKCDLHLGSALSMPTSAASTREGTSDSTTSKFLFKVNTLTFTLNPLIVLWRRKEGTSLHTYSISREKLDNFRNSGKLFFLDMKLKNFKYSTFKQIGKINLFVDYLSSI